MTRAPRLKKASPRTRAASKKAAAHPEPETQAESAALEGADGVGSDDASGGPATDAPAAETAAPEGSAPEGSAPEESAPEGSAPEESAPEESAPRETPDEAATNDAASDGTATSETAPDAASDGTAPDDTANEDAPGEDSQPTLALDIEPARLLPRVHLRGLLEALVFASDKPMTAHELAKLASAPLKEVREILGELRETYAPRGITLGEIAGGWLFRTNAQFAPFVRELTGEKPVRLSRAQLETLAIAAYRQPITRPEIDEIRGVDSGATMKLLLERELLRILGKKDEPGRPLLYGTTPAFLEFFGLKSLKELPTLREFAELSEESRAIAEAELGEVIPHAPPLTAQPPAEAEATESEPAEGEPAEGEPAEGEPAEGEPAEGDALLADVPAEGERADRNGEDGSDGPADDAALADVDGDAPRDSEEGSGADDTAITDPERILGGDE